MVIRNEATGAVLATEATVARSPWARAVGLLGRSALRAGEALIIPRCNAIHTWFMRMPIDVLFLDREQRVVRLLPHLRPFRLAWHPGAQTVLELPAGALAQAAVRPGERVSFDLTERPE